MSKYHYLRFFLNETGSQQRLRVANETGRGFTRHDYLKSLLTDTIGFIHNNKRFLYAHIGNLDRYILGRIGRLKRETIADDPGTGFAEKSQEVWHAANFIMDITNHPDGQKVALEHVQNVGQPFSIAKSLVKRINYDRSYYSGWDISVNPLSDPKEFWKVASDYKGDISELELTFVAPNLFGGHDKTTKLLTDWREKFNIKSATMRFNNNERKLNLEADEIKQGIDYITKGGGKTVMKSGSTKIYDSERKQKIIDVGKQLDFPIIGETETRWSNLIRKIFGPD